MGDTSTWPSPPSSYGGLVAPVNASGSHAGLSNLTLYWDAGWTPPQDPDLEQQCLQAAADAMIEDVAWVAGPGLIRDGAVDLATVPDGFTITFDDADRGTVDFVAPDPVAMVVTAASVPVTHLISTASTTGSIPLSSNPGDGDVVFCGIEGPPPVVEELSCDLFPDTVVVGPVTIVDGAVDPASVPTAITTIELDGTSISFVSSEPVAAVILVASPPELIEYDPEVLEGVLTADLDGGDAVDVYFCIRALTDDPDDPSDPSDPSDPFTVDDVTGEAADDVAAFGTLDDPTTIPTGGGPSGRTTLALIAFVLPALGGSTSLLVWSRGGGARSPPVPYGGRRRPGRRARRTAGPGRRPCSSSGTTGTGTSRARCTCSRR